MAKICQICGKGYIKGNQVPRGIGRRVTRRTTIRQQPNLRSKRVIVDGTPMTIKMCTSCLKRSRVSEEVVVADAEIVEESVIKNK
jgi:large subunit ribosomal protein L28